MTQNDIQLFNDFVAPLIGKPVTHLWHGYGSAIFLEFGSLSARKRRDGSDGNPKGEMTLAIEWSWRVEGKRRIWSGSWSENDRWQRVMPMLVGPSVTSISMFGHLGEVVLSLSNGLRLVSFMTAEGDPEWSFRNSQGIYISVVAGRIIVDTRGANHSLGIADA